MNLDFPLSRKYVCEAILGVNFITVFKRSFYAGRSQKRKKLLELTVFFSLLGSASVTAESKMLVKLTTDLSVLQNTQWHMSTVV